MSSIKQVLGQLTAIRRELRQLHRSPSASRPLSKVWTLSAIALCWSHAPLLPAECCFCNQLDGCAGICSGSTAVHAN